MRSPSRSDIVLVDADHPVIQGLSPKGLYAGIPDDQPSDLSTLATSGPEEVAWSGKYGCEALLEGYITDLIAWPETWMICSFASHGNVDHSQPSLRLKDSSRITESILWRDSEQDLSIVGVEGIRYDNLHANTRPDF